MSNSHFVDSTGLSSQNVASPEDFEQTGDRRVEKRHHSRVFDHKNYAVRVHRHLIEYRNTDNLVANPAWNIIVQKTGYIAEAGKCLVMAAG